MSVQQDSDYGKRMYIVTFLKLLASAVVMYTLKHVLCHFVYLVEREAVEWVCSHAIVKNTGVV